MGALPPPAVPYPAEDPPGRRRACVRNQVDGSRWIELPREATATGCLHRPTLHTCIDQGSVGWPGWLFLLEKCRIRGTLWPDPWHRATNDIKGAVVASGLWLVLLECVCVWNVASGPHDGAAHWGKLMQAGRHLLRHGDASDPWFLLFAEGIAQDHHDKPMDYMSEAHLQRIWGYLPHSKALQGKGDRVKLGRWLSWWDACEQRHESWTETLMLLALHGMKSGYWKDVGSSPLGGDNQAGLVDVQTGALGEDAVAALPGNIEMEQPPRTVKESNKELEKLRKAGRNNIELCIIILNNTVTRRLMHVLRLAVRPLRLAFGKDEVKAKTQRGTLDMHMCWSTGGYNAVLGEVLAVLDDGGALATMGFLSPSAGRPEPAVLDQELMVADRLLKLVVNLIGSRLESMLHYSHCVPGMFVQLLSKDAAVVQCALGRLQEIWKWLLEAEELSLRQPAVHSHLQGMPWRYWLWVRETFILLEEARFKHVPFEVQYSLRGLFTGLLHTKLAEDSFKMLKTMASSNERGVLGRKARWAALLQSRLLTENDRPKLQVPAGAKANAAAQLHNKTFDADVQDFPLSQDTLHEISASSWNSKSVANFGLQSLFLQCCLTVRSWALVDLAWLALLVEPGTLLVPKASPSKAYLVVFTSQWGCLGWPVARMVRGEYDFFQAVQPTASNPQPWQFIAITDLVSHRVLGIKAVPPLAQHDCNCSNGAPGGVLMRELSDGAMAEPMAKAAARRCFKGITVPRLRVFYDLLKVESEGRKPKLERELCAAMVKHLVPDITDVQLEGYMNIRLKPVASDLEQGSVLASTANQEAAEGLLEEDDMQTELKEFVEKKVAPRKGRANAAAPAGTAAAQVEASPAASSSSKSKIPMMTHIPLSVARQWAPPTSALILDTTRHMRWQIQCRNKASPPYSHSKAFGADGAELTQRSALLQCLKWAWECHTAATGVVSPWRFDD